MQPQVIEIEDTRRPVWVGGEGGLRGRRRPKACPTTGSAVASKEFVVAAMVLILAACGIVLWLGVPHAAVYGHDTLIQLDGGWRVLNGQRPHVDFYSAFGPVSYLLAAAGLWVAGANVQGIVYATAAVGLMLGMWAIALARVRLRAWSGALFVGWAVLFWLAPFPLGEPFYLTGYAMQYNRLGYVLASLILVELFVRRVRPAGRVDWGGVSTGVALGLLLFLKVSFFVALCPVLLAAYFVTRKEWKHAAWVLAGFGLVCLAMTAYLDWNLAAMLGDLRIAAAARKTRFLEGYDPFRTILRNWGAAVPLVGLALFAGRTRARLWTFVGVVLAADIVLAMSNTQRAGLPLTMVATLIVAERAARGRRTAVVALVAAMALTPVFSGTVNAWGMVLRAKVSGDDAGARVDAPQMRALVFDAHDEPRIDEASHNGPQYVSRVNDGLALLRRSAGPRDRISCLCFANPFSYALLRQPPAGGSPFFGYGVNFTATAAPDVNQILGDADAVMQLRDNAGDPNARTLAVIAGPELDRRYRVAGESRDWVLWRKK